MSGTYAIRARLFAVALAAVLLARCGGDSGEVDRAPSPGAAGRQAESSASPVAAADGGMLTNPNCPAALPTVGEFCQAPELTLCSYRRGGPCAADPDQTRVCANKQWQIAQVGCQRDGGDDAGG